MPSKLFDTTVGATGQLVVFLLEGQRYALRLAAVERVVRAVEITPLPQAPEIVLGMINVEGRIVPVVNMRNRFGRPERAIELSDQFIIARTSRRAVALVVDSVNEVVACTEAQVVAAEKILPGLEHVEGVLKLPDGMILLHDLDRFLSLDEEQALAEALQPEDRSRSRRAPFAVQPVCGGADRPALSPGAGGGSATRPPLGGGRVRL
jgi:purine-binding chemotaxis protein CheW